MTNALDLLEKDVQKACEDRLELDGWRIFRLEKNWSPKKKKSIGEVGAADTFAVRYIGFALGNVLFIEWKRMKGGRVSQEQHDWHRDERLRGATTWIAGEQFEPNFEAFNRFYEATGLCRRRLM